MQNKKIERVIENIDLEKSDLGQGGLMKNNSKGVNR